eukprot:5107688-Amphidinium_carterae.1
MRGWGAPGQIIRNWTANTLSTTNKVIRSLIRSSHIGLHILRSGNNHAIIMMAIELHEESAINSRARASRRVERVGLRCQLRLVTTPASKGRKTERFSFFQQEAFGATDLQKQFPSAGTVRARSGRSCCNCSKHTPRQGTPCTRSWSHKVDLQQVEDK